MMQAKIIGEREVVERIKRIGPSLRDELKTYCNAFWVNTVEYIRSRKLEGQVLKRKSGTLRDSVMGRTEDSGGKISAVIFAGAEYAAIHEYGGTVPERVPIKKKALHWLSPGGVDVFAMSAKAFKMPKRSFMRTTLAEKKEEFRQGLRGVVGKAIAK